MSEVTERFLADRPRLLSLAHRILGSIHDAEDAVQTAWLRAHPCPAADIENVSAWLTTVVTRVCLDQLRARSRRDALTARVDPISDVELAADEAFLQRDDVSRALMVLLATLTPPQRVAFVLHDLFAVPFDRIADILDTTPTNAKKHASRARSRIRPPAAPSGPAPDEEDHAAVVTAFLQAAGGGDMHRMLSLMAPECVRIADAALMPVGAALSISSAAAIAEETRHFVGRIRSSIPMRVNGRALHVIAPGGHAIATIDIAVRAGLVTAITIAPLAATDVVEAVAYQASGKCDL
ncbi:sigma-70 family RNA polymerase sigma factor [Mycobacterium sp. 236(2023)]|uniref:sigma-70 family RNA polymerase sigma factor n=1 Tax=Mycobacterium sp. 236(2023) TaxID=3038163 RepID=UPI0024154436|nr:sigma-70 family RNA polymerase sigma factor [Mycobacterium sp. 236(2023)]MDG4665974.1 sigma-70 family RNA polymerase sigma factor [Mycobacterium sp. 236(2023)]